MDRTPRTTTRTRPPRAADLPTTLTAAGALARLALRLCATLPMRREAPGTVAASAPRLAPTLLLAATLAMGFGALAPSSAVAAPGKGQFEYLDAPDGVPLCVFETGNPQGKELLLIHGFSQSYAVFKRQYEGALAADHRIVAFDLRGHGCSGKPWDAAAYTDTRHWADDVAAVIRAKKLQRPLIVAWSFGGYVTVHYAKHYGTDGIAGAVLVGSNGGLLPPPTDPKALASFKAVREANARRVPDIEAGIAEGHGFVKIMVAKPAPADMAEIMFATNQMMPTYARRAMSNLPLQLDDVLPKLRAPTLLLVGDKDGSQSVEVLTGLARRLPDGQIKVLAGAGHAAFIDSPQEFDDAIRGFEDYAAGKRAAR
jgi:pimeloyl-ACP methyl ester carboxylesterase